MKAEPVNVPTVLGPGRETDPPSALRLPALMMPAVWVMAFPADSDTVPVAGAVRFAANTRLLPEVRDMLLALAI